MWDNVGDAQMRIGDSVVRYNKRPVLIKGIDDDLMVTFMYLTTGRLNSADIYCPKWDWKPIPTGNVNHEGDAYYIERAPVRKWKQGLHKVNTAVLPEHPGGYQIIYTKAFADCVDNKYPKFAECLAQVDAKRLRGAAFSRMYSLRRNEVGVIYLMYRGIRAGWIEAGEIRLGEEYQFLKEDLQEALA